MTLINIDPSRDYFRISFVYLYDPENMLKMR